MRNSSCEDMHAIAQPKLPQGVDMCGMNDLGGVKFFTITLETPEGDMALMDAVLEGEGGG